MTCNICGAKVAKTSTFCGQCGARVAALPQVPQSAEKPKSLQPKEPVKTSVPVADTAQLAKKASKFLNNDQALLPARGLARSMKMIGASVLGVIVAFALFALALGNSVDASNVSSQSSENSQEVPQKVPMTYSEFAEMVGLEESKKIACKPLAKIAKNAIANKKWKSRVKAAKKASRDSYRAYSYARKHGWTDDPAKPLLRWSAKWDGQIHKAFDSVVESAELTAADLSEISGSTASFVAAFDRDVKKMCNLGKSFEATAALLSKVSSFGSDVVSVAAMKPWYPKGYSEWSSGLAYKFVKKYYNCWGCWYWHMKVVTDTTCPNGIYAELNVEDGGSVVDWTNDSVPYLGAGKKATLRFITYYGYATGDLTELSCY